MIHPRHVPLAAVLAASMSCASSGNRPCSSSPPPKPTPAVQTPSPTVQTPSNAAPTETTADTPLLKPMAALQVLHVETHTAANADHRAIVVREETTHGLLVEYVFHGDTEGDPSTLRYQAWVELPPAEANRISSLRWKAEKKTNRTSLSFALGSLDRTTHECHVVPPRVDRFLESPTPTQKTLQPRCVKINGTSSTR